MTDLIIIGAGGLGLEIAAYAEDSARAGRGDYVVKGFLDDTKPRGAMHAGYTILGGTDTAIDPGAHYIIAVGDPGGRASLIDKFTSKGAAFASIIHPQSYVAKDARIDAGTLVAPFVFVGPRARVGKHGLLNVHACVGHESNIGDSAILAPYASIHGWTTLGDGVFLGEKACVTARLKVGEDTKIFAGAVVYTDIPPRVSAFGNPASFRADKRGS
jgi:sugar O-acyltransferase (sialic acid O-acetyltransferase NeuD family)